MGVYDIKLFIIVDDISFIATTAGKYLAPPTQT